MMHNLKALGITGRLENWIHNFLTSRKQQVIINGVKSIVTNVTYGVPQGKSEFMKTLYKSMIVSHVDYCSQLWMPTKFTEIGSIEKLQKDFLC